MLRRKMSDEAIEKILEKAHSTPEGRAKSKEWEKLFSMMPMIGRMDPKDIPDFFQKNLPINWKIAYPRIYLETNDYYSPRILAAWLMEASIMAAIGHVKKSGSAGLVQDAISTVFMLAQRNKIPQLFMAKELLEAVMRTDVPKDLKWWDVKLPFQAGFLYLPKGCLKNPKGDDVGYIGWARLTPEEFDPSAPMPCHAFQIAVRTMDEMGSTYTKLINSEEDLDLFDLKMDAIQPEDDPFALEMDSSEEEFMVRMVRLTISLLMIPSAREELWEKEKKVKTVHCKKRGDKEFWQPGVIGRHYKIPRIESVGGSHASPRAHWRRGHYRNQKFGKELRESKIIWIEPTLVMGDE